MANLLTGLVNDLSNLRRGKSPEASEILAHIGVCLLGLSIGTVMALLMCSTGKTSDAWLAFVVLMPFFVAIYVPYAPPALCLCSRGIGCITFSPWHLH